MVPTASHASRIDALDHRIDVIVSGLDEVIGAVGNGADIIGRRHLDHLLLGAIATERRHLAGELHDGLGQELFGLSLLAKSLANSVGTSTSSLRDDLLRLADLSRKAMETCRGVAHGLSPLSDWHGSLVDALRNLALMPANWSGPIVTFSVAQSSSLRLGRNATDHLYRLAQEGLANALKHAAAKTILIVLDVTAKLVKLEIVDDGIGMPIDRARAASGIGLNMMRYRANLLHGTFRVAQRPAGGARLIITCKQDS